MRSSDGRPLPGASREEGGARCGVTADLLFAALSVERVGPSVRYGLDGQCCRRDLRI